MKTSIEIHNMEPADEYFVGTCTHLDESEEIDACARRRLTWLRAMHPKGSRAKVASLDGKRAGFLHVIPIEFCPWGPLGRDLMVIPCLVSVSKGHGVAKALLAAADEEARNQGRKGIVTIGYYHDFWFMPASFFEANGFLKCGGSRQRCFDPKSRAAVLWRAFDGHIEAPLLFKPKYEFEAIPGRVVIDLFWNEFCQTSNIEAQRVREVAAEFGDLVTLNQYSADDRAALLHCQIERGIFVNGREIYWGHEAPKDGIREAITHALPALGMHAPRFAPPCTFGPAYYSHPYWKFTVFDIIVVTWGPIFKVRSFSWLCRKLEIKEHGTEGISSYLPENASQGR
jgi:GNAT superfamily N-acetyltransferase